METQKKIIGSQERTLQDVIHFLYRPQHNYENNKRTEEENRLDKREWLPTPIQAYNSSLRWE